MLRVATRASRYHAFTRSLSVQDETSRSVAALKLPCRWYGATTTTDIYDKPKTLAKDSRRLRRHHGPVSVVKNLDPHNILPEDYIDLSLQNRGRVYFNQEDISNRTLPSILKYAADNRPNCFPSGCRGFFYFFEDPFNRPSISGLRFRIANEASQEGFDSGRDLLLPGSDLPLPWSYSLLRIWNMRSGWRPHHTEDIFKRMDADGVLDKALLSKWETALKAASHPSKSRLIIPSKTRVLASLDTPFEIELSEGSRPFYILDEERSRLLSFDLLPQGQKPLPRPYKGRCLVRLESLIDGPLVPDLPRTCNIRIIKLLTPVTHNRLECEGYENPEEGSLIHRYQSPLVTTIIPRLAGPQRQASSGSKEGRTNSEPINPSSDAPASDRPKHCISTLDPTRLQPQDYVSFRLSMRNIHTSASPEHLYRVGCTTGRIKRGTHLLAPFPLRQWPEGTNGFLYFHHDPILPLISASIRLRITSSASVKDFQSGKDFMLPGKDCPWQVLLLNAVNRMNYRPLVAQLMQDGLVTEEVLQQCQRIGQIFRLPQPGNSVILWHPEQPFKAIFDQSGKCGLYIVDAERGAVGGITQSCTFKANKYDWRYLTAGQCMFRLQLLPNLTQSGQQQYHLRLLKILEPGRVNNTSNGSSGIPEEGSLLTRRGEPAVFSFHPKVVRPGDRDQ